MAPERSDAPPLTVIEGGGGKGPVEPIVVGVALAVDRPTAFTYLERPERLRLWLGEDCALHGQVGGPFAFRDARAADGPAAVHGRVLAIEAPELVTVEWKGEGWPCATLVRLRIEDAGPRASWLAVNHEGFERMADHDRASALRESELAAWRDRLARLEDAASY